MEVINMGESGLAPVNQNWGVVTKIFRLKRRILRFLRGVNFFLVTNVRKFSDFVEQEKRNI
jgi:hypothetical protein